MLVLLAVFELFALALEGALDLAQAVGEGFEVGGGGGGGVGEEGFAEG